MDITIDVSEPVKRYRHLQQAGGDIRAPLRRFAQYMRIVTDRHFQQLRRGGSWRGVTWKYFADQYTRKTDGVTVPAWGGVPKVRGRGAVKGRLRPSGQRVQRGDAIVQDTGTLRARAATVMVFQRKRLELGTNLQYAAKQQAMRPFLFFTRLDRNQLVKFVGDHLMKDPS